MVVQILSGIHLNKLFEKYLEELNKVSKQKTILYQKRDNIWKSHSKILKYNWMFLTEWQKWMSLKLEQRKFYFPSQCREKVK